MATNCWPKAPRAPWGRGGYPPPRAFECISASPFDGPGPPGRTAPGSPKKAPPLDLQWAVCPDKRGARGAVSYLSPNPRGRRFGWRWWTDDGGHRCTNGGAHTTRTSCPAGEGGGGGGLRQRKRTSPNSHAPQQPKAPPRSPTSRFASRRSAHCRRQCTRAGGSVVALEIVAGYCQRFGVNQQHLTCERRWWTSRRPHAPTGQGEKRVRGEPLGGLGPYQSNPPTTRTPLPLRLIVGRRGGGAGKGVREGPLGGGGAGGGVTACVLGRSVSV